jgi:hypothetical protein
MICKQCGSDSVGEFRSEIAIHFPGPEGYKQPHVFVSSSVRICSNCGFTEFGLSAEELEQIRQGITRPKDSPHYD